MEVTEQNMKKKPPRVTCGIHGKNLARNASLTSDFFITSERAVNIWPLYIRYLYIITLSWLIQLSLFIQKIDRSEGQGTCFILSFCSKFPDIFGIFFFLNRPLKGTERANKNQILKWCYVKMSKITAFLWLYSINLRAHTFLYTLSLIAWFFVCGSLLLSSF